tara:strand:+ start:903 stop:1052 length:150 start_codon:yes stop_codon:yes gene_type:complete
MVKLVKTKYPTSELLNIIEQLAIKIYGKPSSQLDQRQIEFLEDMVECQN